ncbi:DUF3592 domain-containing protein [Streptomyces sp. SID13726]|uniref:DUF3592 domain-containing protein n=1 Tax=Streptomyces sp. SID13726 TaxID=2706058 RepID=UPI0013B64F50|nr:DUF3592 domain-containing protein [Streptomyces sp. SID13726]NEB04743.1 hypothetical protein [Streptomyces sp. SID13726]
MDAFNFLFYLAPGLIMVMALGMAYGVLRRWSRLRGAWNSGLTAEARCLRTYTTTSGGGDSMVSTTLHHVYEFTTQDGRVVRFEEEGGPGSTVEGDIVTVHHTAGEPVVATAHAPGRTQHAVGVFGTLAFLGVVVAFCVGFMVTFSEMSSTLHI